SRQVEKGPPHGGGSIQEPRDQLPTVTNIPAGRLRGPSEAEEVPNFSLLDQHGRYFELKRVAAKAVVLFFTGNGCPIAPESIAKLQALHDRFAKDDIVVWLVNSNPQDNRASIQEEAEEFHVAPLPILKDDLQGVARSLGVRRTCEAIVVDTREWQIIYRGA